MPVPPLSVRLKAPLILPEIVNMLPAVVLTARLLPNTTGAVMNWLPPLLLKVAAIPVVPLANVSV